jgi:ABC-type xylose transport system permease subunit
VGTLGASLPISGAAGGILAVITYRAQKKWYGDDSESAFIKALILGFLTAIPTPLPAMLYVPSGIVGLVHNLRRR